MNSIWLVAFAIGCGQGETAEAPPEIAAAETAAPETAAPVTAAPVTAAPETAAPETAAPETAAPAPNTTTATKVAKLSKVRRAPVIVYQASWCVPCHTLSAHLTRRGVRHVDKDIDSTPGALDEMNAKTARSGHAGAQLPVMDFRGRIVIGYDPATVDRLCDEDQASAGG